MSENDFTIDMSTVAITSSATTSDYVSVNPYTVSGNIGITAPLTQSKLSITEDANFEGDITINGRSLTGMLDAINDRLAILQPDPDKLEKYAALKEAYEHYKMLEALCK